MTIRVRTDTNLLTTTIVGKLAETFLSIVINNTTTASHKDPNKKIFTMKDDVKFKTGNGLDIMLYKGYYLVVE